MADTAEELAGLLEKARRGDAKTLHALCKKLDVYVRGYFRMHFHETAIVDDLCQETYLHILKNLPAIRKHRKLVSFVAKIAFHVKQDYFREKYRRNEIGLDVPDQTTAFEGNYPVQEFHQANECEVLLSKVDLEAALAQLPQKTRKIFELKTQGYKYDEIANKMQLSLSAVKMRVQRSYETIKTKIMDVTFFMLLATLYYLSSLLI